MKIKFIRYYLKKRKMKYNKLVKKDDISHEALFDFHF